jgi:tRNA1Val (adenine37-N6)-methyltransferase
MLREEINFSWCHEFQTDVSKKIKITMKNLLSIGELILDQPQSGYRFSADSVHLADFVQIFPEETLMDLCTGVGVVPLLIRQRCIFKRALGIELQSELCQIARQNVVANQLEEQIHILRADVRTLTAATLRELAAFECSEYFDVLSVNPPYFRLGDGKLNTNPQKSIARHEITLTLPQLFATCRKFLRRDGRLHLVHLRVRETEIMRELRAHGFQHVERRTVLGDLLLLETRP